MPTREKPKYKVGQQVVQTFNGVIVEVDPDVNAAFDNEMYQVYFPDIGASAWLAEELLKPREDDDAD